MQVLGYDTPAVHAMAGLAASTLCIGVRTYSRCLPTCLFTAIPRANVVQAIAGLSSQATSRVGNIMGMDCVLYHVYINTNVS